MRCLNILPLCAFTLLVALVQLPVFAQTVAEKPAVAEKSAEFTFTLPEESELAGAGPMRRYDWFKNVWNKRRSTFESNRAQNDGAVVFFGDSITQGWGDDFRGAFPGLKKANRGISGDTTRGMLYRLEQDVTSLNPSAVVMLMGTNDLEEKASPETIAGNVQLILAAFKKHNSEMPIILCDVFPSSDSKARPSDKIQEINLLYRRAARDDSQITVVDTWALFADEQGNAKKSEFPDLLHPNQRGYAKWEAALHPIFATLGMTEKKADPFEIEQDAISLFNGKDLSGWMYRPTPESMRKGRERWMGRKPEGIVWPLVEESVSFEGQTRSTDNRFRAINGRLVVATPPEGRCIQQLWTKKEYNEDFQLILEFRATPAADSGVFLRGKQLQCRDFPIAGPYKNLTNFRSGGWNELVVTVRGNKAECSCNGETLEKAFEIPPTGPIGLEGDKGQIEYRRIRVRSL